MLILENNETSTVKLEVVSSISGIDRDDWNSLTGGNPFVSFSFLNNLENTNCLSPQGWYPQHITISDEKDGLLAAMPLFIRDNSYGEFVFDWAWADAYNRAGGDYYPKIVSASPFSPVSGPRLLVKDSIADKNPLKLALIKAATDLCQTHRLSSWHSLFPKESEINLYQECELLIRIGCQYHWFNDGFNTFEDFLESLKSKRRKEIRRERKAAEKSGLSFEVAVGKDIKDEQWSTFYQFYCATFLRKWGDPRLTEEFFHTLSNSPDTKPVLFLAKKENHYVAGAFGIHGRDCLYGRHWGCNEHYDMLHFELCYYRTIDYCIENGLGCLDAGAQGEHKLQRGFKAIKTFSAHWIREPRFRIAISNFLAEETKAVNAYIASKS